MARYKHIDTNPRFLPVDLARQLLPGTFEHALHHLLEHAIDLSAFDARFRNDATGATAYPPALLLKVVLFAYSRGIVSSRGIERACQEHVTFIALCGDTAPHFTTLAHFVSTLGDDIARVFAAVVAICDAHGLIGRDMFAIDGVKLPSNASKHRSGTRADFERQATKLEATAQTMLARHRATDALPTEPTLAAKEATRIARLEKDAAHLRDWLATTKDILDFQEKLTTARASETRALIDYNVSLAALRQAEGNLLEQFDVVVEDLPPSPSTIWSKF